MHESKGQHIDKAPSLHLFHTTADVMLLDHISLIPEPAVGEEKWTGDEARTMPYTLTTLTIISLSTLVVEEVPCCQEGQYFSFPGHVALTWVKEVA